MRRALGSIVCLACFVTGCGESATGPTEIVAPGVWGNDQLVLTATASGATIESGCDSGRIEGPVATDQSGGFSLPGTYAFGRGGPSQAGDPPLKAHSARYVGRITGQTMELTISLPELPRTLGPFQLSFGRKNLLDRCL